MANFASLGIMIGGLTALVPGAPPEMVGVGRLESIVGGTRATRCIAAVGRPVDAFG